MLAHSLHIHRHQSHLKWSRREEPKLTVDAGSVVTFDCIDGGNGQITPESTLDAVTNFNVALADPVFGPVYIRQAEPGDALEVEVIELDTADWGWTAIVPRFGLLHDEFPEPQLKLWKLPNQRNADGKPAEKLIHFNDNVRIPLRPFMGTMGVAPGVDGEFSTIPPSDTGGNIDCRHITKGSRLILPVRTLGALFSCGDGHAAQGDGEVCGSAIETPMKVTLRFHLRKRQSWVKSPHFYVPPPSPEEQAIFADRGSYSTMGIDASLLEATKKAVRAMIEYLGATKGLSRGDAYMLCSVAVNLGLSEVVDMPNHAVTATISLSIFADERAQ